MWPLPRFTCNARSRAFHRFSATSLKKVLTGEQLSQNVAAENCSNGLKTPRQNSLPLLGVGIHFALGTFNFFPSRSWMKRCPLCKEYFADDQRSEEHTSEL